MSETQKRDVILEILNKAVQYSNGSALAVGAIAAGVNAIADAIGAKRVTLLEVVDALETQTDSTDETLVKNIQIVRDEIAARQSQ
jgi:hypothetical protein